MIAENDQARRLRELVRESSRCHSVATRTPTAIAIIGGCLQDGASTVATRLAEELGRRSLRVVVQSDAEWRDGCPDADVQILDVGTGFTTQSERLWSEADLVLLVSTTFHDSILETYTTLKRACAESPQPPVYLVPNRCTDLDAAIELSSRISDTCERFLGFQVPMAAWLPDLTAFDRSKSHAGIVKLAQFVVDRRVLTLDPSLSRSTALECL